MIVCSVHVANAISAWHNDPAQHWYEKVVAMELRMQHNNPHLTCLSISLLKRVP